MIGEVKRLREEVKRLWRAINATQREIEKRADACRELGDIGNARPKAQAYDRAARVLVEELVAEGLNHTLRPENARPAQAVVQDGETKATLHPEVSEK